MEYQGTAHPCAQHTHACSTPTPVLNTLTMPRVPPHRATAQRHNALPAYTQQLQRTCHTQHNVHRTILRTTKQTRSAIHKSTAHTAPGAAHTARTHATTYTPSIHQERIAERSDTPKTNANMPHTQIHRTHKCTVPQHSK